MSRVPCIVLYNNANRKKFRILALGTALQVGFMLNTALFTPKKKDVDAKRREKREKELKAKSDTSTEEQMRQEFERRYIEQNSKVKLDPSDLNQSKNFIDNLRESEQQDIDIDWDTALRYGLMLASGLCCTMLRFFTRRTISNITLLPSGKVRMSFYTTHGFEKKPPSMEFNLNDVSCTTKRTAPTNYVVFRMRHKRFFYMIDKTEGDFYKPELFDQTVGRTREYLYE